MIGVICSPADRDVVGELFELFKTPWELWHHRGSYDVVLCNDIVDIVDINAELILRYGARAVPLDRLQKIEIVQEKAGFGMLEHEEIRFPVYCGHLLFQKDFERSPKVKPSEIFVRHDKWEGKEVVRVGYDLWAEVRRLLTAGQPKENAHSPTLELHITLLRTLILQSGRALVEVPPVPDGYDFIACLTHDVDHPLMRRHKWDHTMFGFIYRATYGSLRKALLGKTTWRNVWRNWATTIRLPFIYFGLDSDPWGDFDRYIDLEPGACSSFFVIPFEGRAGKKGSGSAPSGRAAGYGISHIRKQLAKILTAGCELGLHGIDAWVDAGAAREELEVIREVTGQRELGVRMHWLYFDEQSHAVLEEAGASYDATVGYNETVGYRAGTCQAYKPLGTVSLLELPMHVMDTALFFPDYLDLSPAEAMDRILQVTSQVCGIGGCITVNWHDRSIAPERLWEDVYLDVISEFRSRNAWFATSGQAVAWFRKRRSLRFDSVCWQEGVLKASIPAHGRTDLPALRLRIHSKPDSYVDVTINETCSQAGGDLPIEIALNTFADS